MAQPKNRPLERAWTTADLPDDADVEVLPPPESGLPFSITLIFSPLDSPDFPRALDLARQSPDFRETGTGALTRFGARFLLADAARLREVFNVVGRAASTDILVDGQALPYGRELWIPLVGFFINP